MKNQIPFGANSDDPKNWAEDELKKIAREKELDVDPVDISSIAKIVADALKDTRERLQP